MIAKKVPPPVRQHQGRWNGRQLQAGRANVPLIILPRRGGNGKG